MARGPLFLAFLVAAVVGQMARFAPAHADDGPSATQRASIFAKGSVVRVIGFWEVSFPIGRERVKQYVGGTGSGFFASADGHVVTNAHVVEAIHDGEAKARAQAARAIEAQFQREPDYWSLSMSERATLMRKLEESAKVTANAVIVLPDGTRLPYEIKAYGKPGEGSDVAVLKVDAKDAPNLPIADPEKVVIQDRVLAIGYPGAADMQGLLDDKSQLEATINEGAVSAIKRTSAGEPIIQISASITHGNSGGPTINEKGEVIGLSTFGSRGEVQGFNFLVGAATVNKFLAEAKVDTAPSQTIQRWRTGLEALWDGDLDKAILELDEVLTLFPAHSEAPAMLRSARVLKKEGKGKVKPAAGEGGGAGAAIAVIVVLVVVIGGVVFVMRRSRRPMAAGPGAPAMGGGMGMGGYPPGPPAPAPHAPYGAPPPMGARPPVAMPMQPGVAHPVAKTVAIGSSSGSLPLAATSLGSMALGTLLCTRGQLQGQRFSLTSSGVLIGRQPGVAQIVLNDSRASAKHVWIGYEAGRLVAIDQGTTNGTFVNDVRYGRISKAMLKDGDTVIVSEPDCLSLTIKLS